MPYLVPRRHDFPRVDAIFLVGKTFFSRRRYYYFLIVDTFPIIVFVPEQLHINDGELLSSVLCRAFGWASFYCFRKHQISKVSANTEPTVENTHTYIIFQRYTHFYFLDTKNPLTTRVGNTGLATEVFSYYVVAT